ncbi:threonine dehydratase [Cognatiyoonia sediminum]|uniref:Threonine dehydratase n=1 Tax=Cognatiyoonia sediminum TaxID=1508389 RepID=A0A1M5PLK2_9RHOB|nr:threonine/serine dehydratase [Cognatiyoonia sediminum]SHH02664.1 threonine dehydratase [Cognatiyoonia sediminum]
MNIDMIRAAAKRLEGHARRTPLLSSPFLDEIAGRKLLVKAECLQHTGSFKFRGGWSAVSNLSDNELKTGVIAFSSGNHAQGVALAAREHGAPAVIVMPSNAPEVKIENTRALGAEVVLYDRENESREEIGEALSRKRGLTLIRPFDEPQVIAGQGTCGLEIVADAGVTEADVLVCCGGGGLTGGIALALAAEAPGMTVRPCEPEGFDDVTRSLLSGQREKNDSESGSICDAILTPSPGEITFPILKEHCGPGIVVTEDECLRAMGLAFERLRIVVEPGGAAALAGALFHGNELGHDTVIAVATGGNVDKEVFQRALETLA